MLLTGLRTLATLVAALTFGLAFGLALILGFERLLLAFALTLMGRFETTFLDLGLDFGIILLFDTAFFTLTAFLSCFDGFTDLAFTNLFARALCRLVFADFFPSESRDLDLFVLTALLTLAFALFFKLLESVSLIIASPKKSVCVSAALVISR
jgi:hypothetical protein